MAVTKVTCPQCESKVKEAKPTFAVVREMCELQMAESPEAFPDFESSLAEVMADAVAYHFPETFNFTKFVKLFREAVESPR